MSEQSWLMQALNEASKRAEELPRWARDVNSAVDEFYNRAAPQAQVQRVTTDRSITQHPDAQPR